MTLVFNGFINAKLNYCLDKSLFPRSRLWYLVLAQMLIYLSRYLDLETAKGPFRSFETSCYLLLPVLPHKGIPIKCLVQGHNKRICWLFHIIRLC